MRRQAFPYTVTTPPPGDPLFVSLDDARNFLRLSTDDIDDDELTAFIKAAQAAGERFTKLTFFTTGITTKRDLFTHEIVLRRAPLDSVVSVSRQVADVQAAVAASVWKAIDEGQINWGSIVLKADQIWPSDQDRERRAIEIVFDAGFGVDSTSLPEDLIQGCLRVLADLYEDRGDCTCAGALASMSVAAKALLGRFRIIEV